MEQLNHVRERIKYQISSVMKNTKVEDVMMLSDDWAPFGDNDGIVAKYINVSKFFKTSVVITDLPESLDYPEHYHHHHIERFFVIEGEIDLTVNGRKYNLKTSQGKSVYPGDYHSIHVVKRTLCMTSYKPELPEA